MILLRFWFTDLHTIRLFSEMIRVDTKTSYENKSAVWSFHTESFAAGIIVCNPTVTSTYTAKQKNQTI